MDRVAPPSSAGRLARGPFALWVAVIYLLSFGSQMLLSAPVNARAGVWGFAAAQALLIWAWHVLHVRRLRDAGRPTGLAAGIALVYALEVVLLVIIVWLILSSGMPRGEGAEDTSLLNLFVFLYLIALLTGDPTIGGLAYWLLGIVLLLLMPVAIALGFSIWAGTRESVPPAP
jgi:hypothetical protein